MFEIRLYLLHRGAVKAQSSLHTWTVYVGIYASSEGSEEPPYLDSLYRALDNVIYVSSEGSEKPPYLDSLYRALDVGIYASSEGSEDPPYLNSLYRGAFDVGI